MHRNVCTAVLAFCSLSSESSEYLYPIKAFCRTLKHCVASRTCITRRKWDFSCHPMTSYIPMRPFVPREFGTFSITPRIAWRRLWNLVPSTCLRTFCVANWTKGPSVRGSFADPINAQDPCLSAMVRHRSLYLHHQGRLLIT